MSSPPPRSERTKRTKPIPRSPLLELWALGLALALLTTGGTALAFRDGIQADCKGCHGEGAQVSLALDPIDFEPGDLVRITAAIAGPSAAVGGVFISTHGLGELELIAGEGLRLLETTKATHDSPKPAANGRIEFSIDWHAPADPAAIQIEAYGLAANADNQRSGDGGGYARLSKIVGCLGVPFYRDPDGDGFGSEELGTTTDCAPPPGFALNSGDCVEGDAEIFPGHEELCNDQDDDCDERIDEGAAPTCGLGLCRREAVQCAADAACEPGMPATEVCNLLDDDCDGIVDEGPLCEGNLVCQLAECKTLEQARGLDPNFIPERGFPEIGFGDAAVLPEAMPSDTIPNADPNTAGSAGDTNSQPLPTMNPPSTTGEMTPSQVANAPQTGPGSSCSLGSAADTRPSEIGLAVCLIILGAGMARRRRHSSQPIRSLPSATSSNHATKPGAAFW